MPQDPMRSLDEALGLSTPQDSLNQALGLTPQEAQGPVTGSPSTLDEIQQFATSVIKGIGEFPGGAVEGTGILVDKLTKFIIENTGGKVRDPGNTFGNNIAELGRDITDTISSWLPEDDPRQAGDIGDMVGNALGQVVPLMLGGTVAKAFGASQKGINITMAAATGLTMAADGYTQALAKGADEGEAWDRFLAGIVIGATEAAPLGHLISRLDKGTGGAIKRALVEAAVQGSEELIQEFAQTVMENAADIWILGEDKDFLEGSGTAAQVGGTAGAILGAATQALLGRKMRKAQIRSDENVANIRAQQELASQETLARPTNIEAGATERFDDRGTVNTIEPGTGPDSGNIIDSSETLYYQASPNEIGGIIKAGLENGTEVGFDTRSKVFSGPNPILIFDQNSANTENVEDGEGIVSSGRPKPTGILLDLSQQEYSISDQQYFGAWNALVQQASSHGVDSDTVMKARQNPKGPEFQNLPPDLQQAVLEFIPLQEQWSSQRDSDQTFPANKEEVVAQYEKFGLPVYEIATDEDGNVSLVGSLYTPSREASNSPIQRPAPRTIDEAAQTIEEAGISLEEGFERSVSQQTSSTDGLTTYGLSYTASSVIENRFGFNEYTKPEKRKWNAAFKEAVTRFGVSLDYMESLAKQVNENPQPISDIEHAGMVLKLAQLHAEFEAQQLATEQAIERGDLAAAQLTQATRDDIRERIDRLVYASRRAGSEAGRALNIRKATLNTLKFDFATIERLARIAKTAPLTESELSELRGHAEAIRAAEAEVARLEKLEQEKTDTELEAGAQQTLEIEKEAATKFQGKIEDVIKERAKLINALKGLGNQANDITGLSARGVWVLGRLAISYVHEGVTTLEEVYRRTRIDTQGFPGIVDLTPRDVYEAMNSQNPDAKKRTLSETTKIVRQLQTEARLITEVEDALNGYFKDPVARPPSPERIQELQKILRELRQNSYEARQRRHDKSLDTAHKKIVELQQILGTGYPLPQDLARAHELLRDLRDLKSTRKTIAAKGKIDRTKQTKRQRIAELDQAKEELKDIRKQLRKDKSFAEAKKKIDKLQKLLNTNEPTPQTLDEAQDLLQDLKDLKKVRSGDEKTNVGSLEWYQQQLDSGNPQMPPSKPTPRARIKALDDARNTLARMKAEVEQLIEQKKPFTMKSLMDLGLSRKEAIFGTTRQTVVDGETKEEYIPGAIARQLPHYKRLPITLMASIDWSGILRQGLLLNARAVTNTSRRNTTKAALVGAAKAWGSKHSARGLDIMIQNDPMHEIRLKHKLFISPFEGTFTGKEELFANRLVQSMAGERSNPAFRKWAQWIMSSERHMSTHLNLLRVGVFDQFYRENPVSSFRSAEEHQKAMDAYADYINKATGRGVLKGGIGAALSEVYFAPKFAVSRFQAPLTLFKYWKMPQVRRQIAADLASMLTTNVVMMMLAQLSGAAFVGLDPRDSDFGKMVFGNTRIDPWGGFIQPARLIGAIGMGYLERQDLIGKHLPDNMKVFGGINSIYDLVANFSHYKLAPHITIAADLIQGKNVVGEEVGPIDVAAGSVVTLFLQELYSTFKVQGLVTALGSSVPAWLGMGVSSYGDALKRGDTKQILRNAGFRPRTPTYPDWVNQDEDFKKELDEAFAAQFWARTMVYEPQFEHHPPERQREWLEAIAAQARCDVLAQIGERCGKPPKLPY